MCSSIINLGHSKLVAYHSLLIDLAVTDIVVYNDYLHMDAAAV